ncbi:unnamed protein product [Closterium sp. NIES-64]|nr:unnamed protein product [Closterium sp. NIES-64]
MSLKACLESHAVGELVRAKGIMVDVPHSAPVRDALQLMRMHGISALPVWAPPNEWVGAGGSSIMVTDGSTSGSGSGSGGAGSGTGGSEVVEASEERGGAGEKGAGAGASGGAGAGRARRQYIGMVSVLDVLMHFAQSSARDDPTWALDVPISTLIGHCLEGLSCWTLPFHLSVLDSLEPMSKGVHRVLLPLPSADRPPSGPIVPLSVATHGGFSRGLLTTDCAPAYTILNQVDLIKFMQSQVACIQFMPVSGLSYRLLSQVDLIKFMIAEAQAETGGQHHHFKSTSSNGSTTATATPSSSSAPPAATGCGKSLAELLQLSVKEAGAVHGTVFAVPASMKVLDAIRCMQQAAVAAVAVLEPTPDDKLDDPMLTFGQGRCLVGTLSASDLRACSEEAALTALPRLTVGDFLATLSVAQDVGISAAFSPYAPPPALATLASNSPASSPARMCEARSMVPITCREHSRLGVVMSQAIAGRVHRVWVVADDSSGILVGVKHHAGPEHDILQIRRSSYHDVVRVGELSRLLDLHHIQVYVINSAKVVFINPRPQSRVVKGAPFFCRTCHRTLLDASRYCSIGCKLAALRHDPALTLRPRGGGTAEHAARPAAGHGHFGANAGVDRPARSGDGLSDDDSGTWSAGHRRKEGGSDWRNEWRKRTLPPLLMEDNDAASSGESDEGRGEEDGDEGVSADWRRGGGEKERKRARYGKVNGAESLRYPELVGASSPVFSPVTPPLAYQHEGSTGSPWRAHRRKGVPHRSPLS